LTKKNLGSFPLRSKKNKNFNAGAGQERGQRGWVKGVGNAATLFRIFYWGEKGGGGWEGHPIKKKKEKKKTPLGQLPPEKKPNRGGLRPRTKLWVCGKVQRREMAKEREERNRYSKRETFLEKRSNSKEMVFKQVEHISTTSKGGGVPGTCRTADKTVRRA